MWMLTGLNILTFQPCDNVLRVKVPTHVWVILIIKIASVTHPYSEMYNFISNLGGILGRDWQTIMSVLFKTNLSFYILKRVDRTAIDGFDFSRYHMTLLGTNQNQ